jgi:hypothetical protein
MGFKNIYKLEAAKGIARSTTMPLLVDSDLASLPEPIQRYLRYTGAIGKPKIQNLHAEFVGKMKLKEDGRWMNITAEQYNFYDQPARIFYIKSRLFGIPFDGLHVYANGAATMKIKFASLIPVANAFGPIMTEGETVTLFNDMCVLAPATLISDNVKWQMIDPLTVKATFSNQGYTISAVLHFNEKGELINFVSDDRYQALAGNKYEQFRWSTPVRDYKESNGRTFATYGEAVWDMPKGKFVYAQFSIHKLEYNVPKGVPPA